MTEVGTGNIAAYNYDQLSRITSETKQFAGLSGFFNINYGYDISGNLKSVTDSFNSTVNYNFDKIGRLTGVAGSGFGNVSTLASNMQYRAWGAVKGMTYGNGVQLAMTYNSILLPSRYEVSNLYSYSPPTGTIRGSTYEFYPDGQIKFAGSLADNRFDRAYKYDHASRITETLTGAEARGGTTSDGPYKQSFGYDAWTNVTSFTNRLWTQTPVTQTNNYANNRRQWGWAYDADGRVLSSSDGTHTLDVAARQVGFVTTQGWVGGGQTGNPAQPSLEISQTFDGDGLRWS
jgi:hypothetical protein